MGRLTVCWSLALIPLISGLQFPFLGDYGDNTATGIANQQRVADQMANWCNTNVCEFVLGMGDNFYPQGVTSPTDPRFDSSWKNVYDQPSLVGKTWYKSIGNHDHDGTRPGDGREWNQVLYGDTEPRWHFPNRWYDYVYNDPTGFSVHFAIVDTQSLRWDINDPAAQLAWLDTTLAASTSEWRIVIAHHPPYSAGNYGPGDSVVEAQVLPICKRHKVQFLLSGHDHNLQHMTNATNRNEIDYIISGGGGRGLYGYNPSAGNELESKGLVVNYFGRVYGFTYAEFDATQVTVRHIDIDGNVVHTINRPVSTDPPPRSG